MTEEFPVQLALSRKDVRKAVLSVRGLNQELVRRCDPRRVQLSNLHMYNPNR